MIMHDTMLAIDEEIPRAPSYLVVQIQSAAQHVYSILPSYLQGTSGIIQIITSFVGTAHKWVRVTGDIELLYTNRNTDLYFLFWVCSHLLPLPASLSVLRSQWHNVKIRSSGRTSCVDKGSQLRPVGTRELFYTRTGHLGKPTDLHRLRRSVSWRGHMTAVKPTLSRVGKHVLITTRVHHWLEEVSRVPSDTLLIHVENLAQLDPKTYWDSVILDNICPSTPSVSAVYSRQMSGWISPEWIRISDAVQSRQTTIIYTDIRPSDLTIIEYLFLLQTTFNGETCICPHFTMQTSTLVRVVETLLVEGIISI